MTRCENFSDRLSLFVLGDLSPAESQRLQEHMSTCASCSAEVHGLRDLIGELKSLPLAQVGAPALQEQREMIQEQILAEELRHLPIADPGDAFFVAQRKAIAESLEQETLQDLAALEASSPALISELKELKLPHPGDLFFRRQAKAIQKVLKQEGRQEREGFWAAWAKPLAAAAAVFFLVLGIARITQWEMSTESPDWNMALEYLAVEMDEEVGLETIDQLDDRQLELLANNLEGSIYVESEELLIEEPVDLEDLNEKELDLLINRLEAKAQT